MYELARNSKQIGNVIQRAGKAHGWTQAQLGEQAGLRKATISAIENGQHGSQVQSIVAVLAVLDLEFRICDRLKSQSHDIEDLF